MTAGRPALEYAQITREVNLIVSRHSGNDVRRAAYFAARAALLLIRVYHGPRIAAEMAYALGDELCDPEGGA